MLARCVRDECKRAFSLNIVMFSLKHCGVSSQTLRCSDQNTVMFRFKHCGVPAETLRHFRRDTIRKRLPSPKEKEAFILYLTDQILIPSTGLLTGLIRWLILWLMSDFKLSNSEGSAICGLTRLYHLYSVY